MFFASNQKFRDGKRSKKKLDYKAFDRAEFQYKTDM